jgi:hypothetical protein
MAAASRAVYLAAAIAVGLPSSVVPQDSPTSTDEIPVGALKL